MPGTPLSAAGGEAALDVFVELLPRLWKPAGAPFGTLADGGRVVGRLARGDLGAVRPAVRAAAARRGARGAAASCRGRRASRCCCTRTCTRDNVLAAQREPWLAIDPKPLVGEREFADRADRALARARPLASATCSTASTALTAELGLDRERARGWTIAQTIAWAFDGDVRQTHVETARWLLEAALMLRAVLFDVDFTIARPGPELGPEGYRRLGERFGLDARPRRATTRRASGRSRASSATRSSSTTRRSGSPSPSGSSAAWAATPTAPTSARSR